MRHLAVVALAVVPLWACSKKDSATGLAPAKDWGAEQGGPTGAGGAGGAGGANNPHAEDPNNPHAGLGLNAEGQPEAEDNAHAGLAGAANPHGGMDTSGGTDVSKLGLPPPDPNRPIDPTHHVKGVILIGAKVADHAKPGGAIFVVVKRADAGGQPTGTPLAVDKLTWQKDQLPFELGEAQAMIAGTELTGDVVVTARYDQDGDAISKQPGDIVGQLRVTIPAENVKLVLDQLLP